MAVTVQQILAHGEQLHQQVLMMEEHIIMPEVVAVVTQTDPGVQAA